MKYTSEQQLAIDNCVEFIKNKLDTREFFTLTGPPGSGKTVSIQGILKHFPGKNTVASAISHVATNILSNHLEDLRVDTMTIAQLTGAVANKSNKDIQFNVNPRLSRIQNFDLILIDECSMIDDNTFKVLLNMKRKDAKLIFIGDRYQLPPPEDGKDSPTLSHIDAELTTIMRFEGPIEEIVSAAKAEQVNLADDIAANIHFINSRF